MHFPTTMRPALCELLGPGQGEKPGKEMQGLSLLLRSPRRRAEVSPAPGAADLRRPQSQGAERDKAGAGGGGGREVTEGCWDFQDKSSPPVSTCMGRQCLLVANSQNSPAAVL